MISFKKKVLNYIMLFIFLFDLLRRGLVVGDGEILIQIPFRSAVSFVFIRFANRRIAATSSLSATNGHLQIDTVDGAHFSNSRVSIG